MVAVIKTGRSIHRIFNYNENKVKEGVARCIGQGNYPVEATRLSAGMRLNRLLKRAALNPNVKRNSVHISLNFDPSEKLSDEDMNSIAHTYMKGIGFDKQPYLVYRHEDAGHPHLHICSVNIRADGRRIDMNNIGRNQSEQARKTIEVEFGLVVAERQKKKDYTLEPVNVEKASYGKRTTKAAIQTVLQYVLDRYRYASLPELNAVLNLYNVAAERGGEDSVMYRHNGLQFCLLDDKGNRIGVPLKASLFYNKPTLKNLQDRFGKNKPKKFPHKLKLKNTLDKALVNTDIVSLESLGQALETKGIHLRLRQSTEGKLYGVTFVDHRTQCVFNGSELGKDYSAKALELRLGPGAIAVPNQPGHSARQQEEGLQPQPTAAETKVIANPPATAQPKEEPTMLDTLLQVENVADYLPYHLRKHKKKKKKR
ncbi:relaxase/mobilization nuclease domain-containing protein [Sinomicrobium oceani]|uniref:relaxase/mobilization nuclease domain-containing protein n=1 Tax=Sinomicrobium oceani TaxID=1150368 RepID=UPI00227AE558|nr:relaxase/mobilization nuclease domain-containing protein [Sinomicrobium oceani]